MSARPQAQDWTGMIDQSARLLQEQTGLGLSEWNERVRDSDITDEGNLEAWLVDRGITGYPLMILVMERFGYPDFMLASADDLIDGQYRDRPHLRPILDTVIEVATSVGDVTVQARKGYVSLVTPRRTFSMVRASTRQRVDLGLKLPGAQPVGRLLTAKGLPHGNVRIALTDPAEVDDEVVRLLERSYAANC
ncbi:MAG TPA: DUF5655 domain-containing protein [Nitriliruptorales bacterium]|nr:DUF5655 domain-containing protein [Nitriliruptorales bacterium]